MTMKRLFITLLTALLLVPSGSLQAKKKPENNLRLLYWNIQNGMWDGQRDNYDRFVNWVKTGAKAVPIFLLNRPRPYLRKNAIFLPGGRKLQKDMDTIMFL